MTRGLTAEEAVANSGGFRMPLQLPAGKRLAIALSVDFDAQSLWVAAGLTSPAYLSRGEFGAAIGLPRVLSLLDEYAVHATFPTPGHSILTYPSQVEAIQAAGHEIAAHGAFHEQVPLLNAPEERRLMELQLGQHERVLGKRPRGYRSPSWDFTDATLAVLEEYGFDWDSSLMGRDFEPYHPRPVRVDAEAGNSFGPPSPILEFPVSWYLDDFPFLEFVPSLNLLGATSASALYERWAAAFDFAMAHVESGVFTLTVHPQTIGRAQNLVVLERLMQHMTSQAGAWFAPLSDIYACWHEESAKEGDEED